ncbi:MAG: hypothetical protein K2J79_03755 [Ruminiclostridium sp.]|nr:hypothetical protein [Ruminiclostridium sp.]
MKKTNKAKAFSVIKTAVIAALAGAAGYIAFAVPDTVQSMVPTAETVSAEICEYCPTVTAKGTIIKQGERWLAVVAVNEADISLIEEGQTAYLNGAALAEGKYRGSVIGIGETAYTLPVSTSAIPETVVDVTVSIESGSFSELRSGYSVTAQLKTGDERMLTMLPYTAIGQDDKGEYVYILENGISVRKDIVTGIELSDKTEIVSGLNAEDRVLTYPENVLENSYYRVVKR